MGRSQKNVKPIVIIVVVFSAFLGSAVTLLIQQALMAFQVELFKHSTSILFTASSEFWTVFSYFFPFILLFSLFVFLGSLIFSLEEVNRQFRVKKSNKYVILAIILGVFFLVLSIFNYCDVTARGIFIRDISTLYTEKFYRWRQLEKVNILSYKERRSTTSNLRFILIINNRNINLMNSIRFDKNFIKKLRQIYLISQTNHIPIEKRVDYIDNYDLKQLNYIENGIGSK